MNSRINKAGGQMNELKIKTRKHPRVQQRDKKMLNLKKNKNVKNNFQYNFLYREMVPPIFWSISKRTNFGIVGIPEGRRQ